MYLCARKTTHAMVQAIVQLQENRACRCIRYTSSCKPLNDTCGITSQIVHQDCLKSFQFHVLFGMVIHVLTQLANVPLVFLRW